MTSTDSILAEIEQTITNIKAAWDEKTNADAARMIDLFNKAIQAANIDTNKIRQDIRDSIKHKFNDIYDTRTIQKQPISGAIFIDIENVWKEIPNSHFVINDTTYVFSGRIKHSEIKESSFYWYIMSLPPVDAVIKMLEKEFPAAFIEFDLEFRDGFKTMIFKVEYEYDELITKLPQFTITN